ncbi:hypothetical protein SAMN05428977_10307 [Nitrosomonas sp. Nm166]|nr:hypothetical protein SAMN05428977_10307 [Nitrosomonas sp. Nm166]
MLFIYNVLAYQACILIDDDLMTDSLEALSLINLILLIPFKIERNAQRILLFVSK